MRKWLFVISALAVAGVGICSNSVAVQEAVGVHNPATAQDRNKQLAGEQKAVASDMKSAIEAGQNVADAFAEHGGEDKIERVGATFISALQKVTKDTETCDARVDSLDMEVQALDTRWSDDIDKIMVPAIKAVHERRHDTQMKALRAKLAAARGDQATLHTALQTSESAKAALASLREDRLATALGGRLDDVVRDVQNANSALAHALASLSTGFGDSDQKEVVSGS